MKAFSDLSIIWFVDEDALIDTYIYIIITCFFQNTEILPQISISEAGSGLGLTAALRTDDLSECGWAANTS